MTFSLVLNQVPFQAITTVYSTHNEEARIDLIVLAGVVSRARDVLIVCLCL